MMKKLMIFLALLSGPAAAQQSPSALALQINGVIGQWAQAIESLQVQNAKLEKQLADIKAKCGEPCKDAPAK